MCFPSLYAAPKEVGYSIILWSLASLIIDYDISIAPFSDPSSTTTQYHQSLSHSCQVPLFRPTYHQHKLVTGHPMMADTDNSETE